MRTCLAPVRMAPWRKEPLASNERPSSGTPTGDAHERFEVDGIAMVRLLGPQDRLLKTVESEYPLVKVLVRGNEVTLDGDPGQVQGAKRLVEELISMVRNGQELGEPEVATSARMLRADPSTSPAELLGQAILTTRGKTIRPKTLGQKTYVDAIDQNTIVFGIGPAGTGKTYLAMAKAVQALQRKEVNRIILTRPAVEAGERLGFLPGTLNDKIDPYLRPLYDALNEMLDPEVVPKLLATGTVEVAPLAYMRGRTLNDSFIILDEAQNTSPEQMKMFLTRLGFGSKIVVTGDITQIDLPAGASGLQLVTRVLSEIDDIHFATLTSDDVVRHSLVGRIVDAYTKYDAQRSRQRGRGDRPVTADHADHEAESLLGVHLQRRRHSGGGRRALSPVRRPAESDPGERGDGVQFGECSDQQSAAGTGAAGVAGNRQEEGDVSDTSGVQTVAACACGCGTGTAEEGGRKALGVDPEIKSRNLTRLRRIEGQVRGLQKMIDEDRYCADVLVQLSSVHEALRSVSRELMRNHLKHCASSAIRAGADSAEAMYDELVDMMYKHSR